MTAFGGSQYLGGDVLSDVPGDDPQHAQQRERAAALTICGHAEDKADAIQLLTACGLLPEVA